MNKIQRMQNEVEQFLMSEFDEKVYHWITPHNFVDECGFDGYIFKSDLAAIRYCLGTEMQNCIDYCDSAADKKDWLEILTQCGAKREKAKKELDNDNWEWVVRFMVKSNGAKFFLSSYSGRVTYMDNGMILYY